MIELCHIAPTKFLDESIADSDRNLVLAHIAEVDDEYAAKFKASSKYTMLDNGAFEKGIPFDVNRLLKIAEKVGADLIVAPDYPYDDYRRGMIKSVVHKIKSAGYDVMHVPQSRPADFEGFMSSLLWGLTNKEVDIVGLSIIGVPNALEIGVSSRKHLLEELPEYVCGKYHILGMLDSVDEISMLKPFEDMIVSWDTSAAYWYGLNGLSVKGRDEKFTIPVDFNFDDGSNIELAKKNVEYMRGLL